MKHYLSMILILCLAGAATAQTKTNPFVDPPKTAPQPKKPNPFTDPNTKPTDPNAKPMAEESTIPGFEETKDPVVVPMTRLPSNV